MGKNQIFFMITIKRTDSDDPDFKALVKLLDAELKILDGEEHLFYAQLNKVDNIKQVLVAYDDDQAVGCGAIRFYSNNIMEVKRMYVLPNKRGQGIAGMILKILEEWSIELNIQKLILETGVKQPEAIGLYKKCGYNLIPNYGKYKNMENSRCFKKQLKGNG